MQIWMSYSNSACRITSIYWISVWYIISPLNYSEIPVIIVCKLVMSPDLVYNDILCKFECYVRIRHVELPLYTEFQLDISFPLLNYSEICVLIVCKLITSPYLVYNDILCKFECHVRIQHVELPLYTEFQVDISFLFWIIAKCVFSLSLNWLRHQIWSLMTFYANLNAIFEFSMSNYPYISNFSLIYHFPFEL